MCFFLFLLCVPVYPTPGTGTEIPGIRDIMWPQRNVSCTLLIQHSLYILYKMAFTLSSAEVMVGALGGEVSQTAENSGLESAQCNLSGVKSPRCPCTDDTHFKIIETQQSFHDSPGSSRSINLSFCLKFQSWGYECYDPIHQSRASLDFQNHTNWRSGHPDQFS